MASSQADRMKLVHRSIPSCTFSQIKHGRVFRIAYTTCLASMNRATPRCITREKYEVTAPFPAQVQWRRRKRRRTFNQLTPMFVKRHVVSRRIDNGPGGDVEINMRHRDILGHDALEVRLDSIRRASRVFRSRFHYPLLDLPQRSQGYRRGFSQEAWEKAVV